MWEIVRAGGPLMWPIIFCSIVAAAIVLERLWTLQDKRVLRPSCRRRSGSSSKPTRSMTRSLPRSSRIHRWENSLRPALANRHRPREILMERLEDTGRHVVYELERFLNSLGTIASISPLLGLLGTVTGIIRSFNAIQSGGMGDPRALSGGIAEALIATVAGLCVAIPSLIAYRYLRGKVERIVVEMGEERDADGGRGRSVAVAGGAVARVQRPLPLECFADSPVNLKPRRHEEPEINVVSLIDVVLLLVVFFMLSSRFTDEGRMRVHLPQANAVPPQTSQSERWSSP